MSYQTLLNAVSRMALAAAFGLAVSACSSDAPQDKGSETGSAKTSEGSGPENNTKGSKQKDRTEENGGKDPANADCSDIKWGSSLKIGGIIPKSQAKGFLDTDGDKKADDKEQEVGMCQLHQRSAKCGLIVTGWNGCVGCPDEFRTVGDRMEDLRKANVAVYAIYSQVTLDRGMKIMEKYFGTRPDMYSNSSEIAFEFAPMKILVKLDTMEILNLDRTEKGQPVDFHVQEAIDTCKKL